MPTTESAALTELATARVWRRPWEYAFGGPRERGQGVLVTGELVGGQDPQRDLDLGVGGAQRPVVIKAFGHGQVGDPHRHDPPGPPDE